MDVLSSRALISNILCRFYVNSKYLLSKTHMKLYCPYIHQFLFLFFVFFGIFIKIETTILNNLQSGQGRDGISIKTIIYLFQFSPQQLLKNEIQIGIKL
jgi:hypothetical protein